MNICLFIDDTYDDYKVKDDGMNLKSYLVFDEKIKCICWRIKKENLTEKNWSNLWKSGKRKQSWIFKINWLKYFNSHNFLKF